ncbi:MAG: flagellar hook-basal body complex protein FliE [Edaphobacter sp.]|uniref:flagellar hook-basal body complex protein FliE n=1 Tax=Edaphobacter sp. TaxID=1934404 RepID=UPI00238433B7|nr:flagellar hook-basal body complex protein FliE [Edaphobacter sp.]MDE1178369.1 flagellar hook-basal body complex protein FliE [Edaphobacter sp.]
MSVAGSLTSAVTQAMGSAMTDAITDTKTSAGGGTTDGTPFAGLLQSMVAQTGELDRKASDAVTGVMNGSGTEIHDAMIATQKADMAFELALQVRNKAVGAYQQMMSMQF